MFSKSSEWELGFVYNIAKFTISRLVILRFECIYVVVLDREKSQSCQIGLSKVSTSENILLTWYKYSRKKRKMFNFLTKFRAIKMSRFESSRLSFFELWDRNLFYIVILFRVWREAQFEKISLNFDFTKKGIKTLFRY